MGSACVTYSSVNLNLLLKLLLYVPPRHKCTVLHTRPIQVRFGRGLHATCHASTHVLVGDCMRRPHDTGPEKYMDERGHARRPLHVFGPTAVCSKRAAHGTYIPVRKDAQSVSLEMNRGNTPRPLGVGGCTTSTLVVSTRPRHNNTTQKNTYIVFYIDTALRPF